MSSPDFQFPHSDGWFGAHERVWDAMFAQIPIKRAVEIGAFEGRCTTYMMRKIQENGGGEVVVIDTWEVGQLRANGAVFEFDMAEVYETFRTNTALAQKEYPDVHLMVARTTSDRELLRLLEEQYVFEDQHDLVYVDGAHDAMNALRDMVLGFELLRPGGILVVDDYLWQLNNNPAHMPRTAINTFMLCYAEHVNVLLASTNAQVFLQKKE